MTRHIHLNADIGELSGQAGRDIDAAILKVVSQCNIACGGHAGDADTMRATVRAAKAQGVHIGAHPSYPDREGFGRRIMDISIEALEVSLVEQITELKTIAEKQNAIVTYVKAHGALYNQAVKNADLARCIARATQKSGIPAVMSLPFSEIKNAARAHSLEFIPEAFADRAYQSDGQLVPRSMHGAVLEDSPTCASQAASIALQGHVRSISGDVIKCEAETITLHSDTMDAIDIAVEIRRHLMTAGLVIGYMHQASTS